MADQFTDLSQMTSALAGLRRLLQADHDGGTAFAAALLDAILAPGAARDALGWREGESVLVMYGLGFDTVTRAALDGATLRATVERAAAASHFALTTRSLRGHSYYRIDVPTPAFSFTILLRLERDGAVLAIGGDEDRLLDELLADLPGGPRFDPGPVLAAAYPDRRADARFSMTIVPRRLSSALAKVVARRPPWLLPLTPCAEAGVGLLAATPTVSLAWVPARSTMHMVGVVDVDGATADRLGRELRAIPRWSEGGERMRLGLGVGPRALLDVLSPWATVLDRTIAACGGDQGAGGMTLAMLRVGVLPPALELLDAAVVEVDPRRKLVAALVATHDPQALWASMRGFVPLRPQSPAPGEQVAFQNVTFVGGADALGVAIGDGGVDALTTLLAGDPGPRELFAMELGRGVFDAMGESNPAFAASKFAALAFHVGVRDHRVVVAMTAELAGTRPQLAH